MLGGRGTEVGGQGNLADGGGFWTLRRIWGARRWAYGAYMLVAVARIPLRTGFHLEAPRCDTRLTLANAQLSLTKVPHVVLFAIFFVITAIQFDRFDRRAVAWSLIATAVLGLIVEFEEGATRTGNCRLTDVLPDIVGGVIAAGVLGLVVRIWARWRRA